MALFTYDVCPEHIPAFKTLIHAIQRQGFTLTLKGSTVRDVPDNKTRFSLATTPYLDQYIAGYLRALADTHYNQAKASMTIPADLSILEGKK